jgi:exosortase
MSTAQPIPSANFLSGGHTTWRWLLFVLWLAVSIAVFSHPLRAWLSFSLADDDASHLPIIPLLAAFVMYLERENIFREVATDLVVPPGLLSCSIAICVIVTWNGQSWLPVNRLCGFMLALVLLWIAGFIALFGRVASRRASFPLLFLFLMVPFPQFLLDRVIYFLQKGSADVASILFDITGVPVLHDGFRFYLAHVSIEVAKECSGIRSSMALILLALLVVHFRLETTWKKIFFIAVGILVMVLKNGIRIVALTLLASYVDPGFLYGRLHRQGGVAFFLIGLLLLAPVLWLLERNEPHPVSSTTA